VDAVCADGLDLDLVDQMKDLSVVTDDDGDDDSRSRQRGSSDVFDRSAPSTKVSELFHLVLVIHAEHVVHRRGYCFHFGCMYVCMFVSALERKRLVGMT